MDIRKIRLINLNKLVAENDGKIVRVAEKAGTDPSYLSQIINPNLRGSVGHDLARRLEKGCKKPKGWMDKIHDMDYESPEIPYNEDLFRLVAQAVESALKGEKMRLTDDKKWEVISKLYKYYSRLGAKKIDLETIIDFIQLAA